MTLGFAEFDGVGSLHGWHVSSAAGASLQPGWWHRVAARSHHSCNTRAGVERVVGWRVFQRTLLSLGMSELFFSVPFCMQNARAVMHRVGRIPHMHPPAWTQLIEGLEQSTWWGRAAAAHHGEPLNWCCPGQLTFGRRAERKKSSFLQGSKRY